MGLLSPTKLSTYLICIPYSAFKIQPKTILFDSTYYKLLKLATTKFKGPYLFYLQSSDGLKLKEHEYLSITGYLYENAYGFFSEPKVLKDANVVFGQFHPDLAEKITEGSKIQWVHLKNQSEQFPQLSTDSSLEASVQDLNDIRVDSSALEFPLLDASPSPGPFSYVALGGTFDHLHLGHKVLLSAAGHLANNKLFCGIMDISLLKKKRNFQLIEDNETRLEKVKEFLKLIRPDLDCEVGIIHDSFGPTITQPNFDTLIVSKETLSGGKAVNDKRKEIGFKELDLHVVEVLADPKKQGDDPIMDKLSSTAIRDFIATQLPEPTTKP